MPRKHRMKKATAPAIFLIAVALLALGTAAAQNQEESSLFGGIVIEAVPAAPTDLAVTAVGNSHITLNWRDNSADETKFEIWRAVFSGDLHLYTQVGPNVTTYTDSSLESGTTYSYLVRACNGDGCADSNVVSATTSGDSDDHVYINCFIATAVYRDAHHPDVQALRDFRDKYLMTNRAGRALVDFYYRHSPPFADFVAAHEPLRIPLRAAFIPVAASARHPLAALLVFAGIAAIGTVAIKRRK